ncbi:Uncharacterised protein [Mycobacteroides abscessus]|nr:Uncharacterised protein [Mycobacteroides abscessus]
MRWLPTTADTVRGSIPDHGMTVGRRNGANEPTTMPPSSTSSFSEPRNHSRTPSTAATATSRTAAATTSPSARLATGASSTSTRTTAHAGPFGVAASTCRRRPRRDASAQ